MSINWEAVEKWRDALYSGKYEKTTGSMYLSGRYCCLGIFQRQVQGRQVREFLNPVRLDPIGMGELWVTDNPKIFGVHATSLNDGSGGMEEYSHDEIADLLTIALMEKDGIE